MSKIVGLHESCLSFSLTSFNLLLLYSSLISFTAASGEAYLWETSSVVTVDDVDMTFFPATSTASHTLPSYKNI